MRTKRSLGFVTLGLRSRSSSDPAQADLQRQPPALQAQPQHCGVPPQTGRPPLEAIGRDRRPVGRLPVLTFCDRVPPHVERAAVPSPPGLVLGRSLPVSGNRAAGRLGPRDRPLQSPLSISISNGHRSQPGDFVTRSPLHAHSRGPRAPLRSRGSLAMLARIVVSGLCVLPSTFYLLPTASGTACRGAGAASAIPRRSLPW